MNAIKVWSQDHKLFLKTSTMLVFCACLGFTLLKASEHLYHTYYPHFRLAFKQTSQKVNISEIEQYLYQSNRTSLLELNVSQLHQHIMSLPWVKTVRLHRQWPETLSIQIEEYEPIVRFNEDSWLSHEGYVFQAPMREELQEYSHIEGDPTQSKRMLQFFLASQQNLNTIGLSIHKLSLSPRNAWRLVLSNGLLLKLGQEARTERLKRFIDSYFQIKKNVQLYGVIDLRYDSGIAISQMQEQER